PVVAHLDEAAVHGRLLLLPAAEQHPHLADLQRAQERGVVLLEGDVAALGPADDHLGLAGVEDALGADHLDVHDYASDTVLALAIRSSTPPTATKACSGMPSKSPSTSFSSASTVSSAGTLVPGMPVNGSPAYMGWPRNFSTLRARATSTLSSSVSSSMP